MIRRADLKYQTPAGYVDDFFGYVFDADNLPDGADYHGNVVPIEADSDFVLRKIDGMGTILKGVAGVNGQWWLKDAGGAHVSAAPIFCQNMAIAPPLPAYDSEAVLPERTYPASGAIRFDLLAVKKQLYVSGGPPFLTVPAAQFIFTGVKRYPGSVKDSAYRYRLLPYSYTIRFLIDWDVYTYIPPHVPSGRTPAQQFYISINDLDFELWGVVDEGAPPGAAPPASHAKVQLYDAAGRARYSRPVLADWFAYNSPYSVGNPIAPGILYPVGSQIKFDLYSMMFGPPPPFTEPGFPLEREWTFFGVQRVPVSTGGGA
jgi:hypothetical protein